LPFILKEFALSDAPTPKLDRISLTGPDDKVSLAALSQLSERYPFVEWALLYVPHNEGAPRNPTQAWRRAFFDARLPGYSAVHLCGRQAFEELLQGALPSELLQADRLQLNINARKPDFTDAQVLEVFHRALDLGPDIILQYHEGTAALVAAFVRKLAPAALRRVHVLLDESKGTGKVMSSVSPPPAVEDLYCGFAGGLGPDNIAWALSALERTGKHYWADMESGIRTNNEFDMEKARLVLEAGDQVRAAAQHDLSDEPPRTFGCHHFAETCGLCEGLVERWKAKRRARGSAE
jgi:hypothetical protein